MYLFFFLLLGWCTASSCAAGLVASCRTPSWGFAAPAQVAVMTAVGPLFGLSRIQALRAGLLLAAGGEFAFVAL